jgi:hypothetical protein
MHCFLPWDGKEQGSLVLPVNVYTLGNEKKSFRGNMVGWSLVSTFYELLSMTLPLFPPPSPHTYTTPWLVLQKCWIKSRISLHFWTVCISFASFFKKLYLKNLRKNRLRLQFYSHKKEDKSSINMLMYIHCMLFTKMGNKCSQQSFLGLYNLCWNPVSSSST